MEKRTQISGKYGYYKLMFRAKEGERHANDRRVIRSAHARSHGKVWEPIQTMVRTALDDATATIEICSVVYSTFNTLTIQFVVHARDDFIQQFDRKV